MKSPEDRDAFGNWAFDARATLDLSADWVAKELGVSRPTIVKAEGKERSRRTERELPALYMRLARERGVILQPLPGQAAPATPAPAPDMAALVSVLTNMVTEMRRQNDRAVEAQAQLADGLAALTEEVAELRAALRAHEGAGGPHGAPKTGAENVPPSQRGGPRKSQASVR